MHTASSASCTARESLSASLYATTEAMPAFRHARRMRSAISPRFAIRIFVNTRFLSLRFHACDRLAELDCLAGLDLEGLECAADRADHLLPHTEHVDVSKRITAA